MELCARVYRDSQCDAKCVQRVYLKESFWFGCFQVHSEEVRNASLYMHRVQLRLYNSGVCNDASPQRGK